MHIDDWNTEFLSKFDPETYVENLKLAKIKSAMIYLQSHVGLCYWPTVSGKMHNGYIGCENKTKRLIELCMDEGIYVTGYYSLIYDTYQNDKHPEWRIIDKDGNPARNVTGLEFSDNAGSRYGLLCPNNPAYRSYTETQIKEIADYFPKMDGMFYDMLFWPKLCYCEHCKTRWKNEVGGELPTFPNDRDPIWRLHMAKRREWMGEYAQWATDITKKYMPGVSVQHNAATTVVRDDRSCAEGVINACDYLGGDLYSNDVFARLFFKNATPDTPFEYMLSRCSPNLAAHTQIKSLDVMRSEVFKTVAHHGASFVIDAIDPVGTMDRRVYEQIGKVYTEMEPYEPYYYGEPIEDVGVYYSLKGKVALFGDKWSNYQGASTAINTFIEKNITTAVTGGFADLDKHQAVVISATTADDEYDTARIVDYVKRGGKVYFSGGEHKGLLEAFFGAKSIGYTEERIVYIAPKDDAPPVFEYYTKEFPLRFEWSSPIIEGMSPEKVLATITLPYTKYHTESRFASIHSNPPGISTNFPALAVTEYGKGKVVWCAVPIECYEFYDYRNILVNIVEQHLGINKSIISNAPYDVELVAFKAPSEVLIDIVLHNNRYKARRVESFDVTVNCDFNPTKIYKLPEGKELAFDVCGNSITFKCEDLDVFAMYQIK